ncbi:MAG: bifunctional 3-deoxy-7-phosphoheptulonate synthase/chorismate mutase type II [Vicingaceae bacterium]
MKEEKTLKIDSKWAAQEPFQFFGPCSAESLEQLDATAKQVAAIKNNIFRAGVWKPRTRPGSFQGIGEEALNWLVAIKEKYHLKVATEVAHPDHLEKALKAGIDVLWIGARTTVNPFSVQALADALQGIDVPVFVKNPINPDLSLWMGALERINKAGITKLGAIHRGFHLNDNGPYRNTPNWNLAIQLKATYPELPVVCDVSHIGGKSELIPHLAQKALDLDMDGLMIETHHQPDQALSDKQQQLTPKRLKEILGELVQKKSACYDQEFQNRLELLRAEIDKVDDDLIDRIAHRMEIVKQIGQYKKDNQVTILQLERWKEILKRALKNGAALGVESEFIEVFYNAIHDESIRQQTIIQSKDDR